MRQSDAQISLIEKVRQMILKSRPETRQTQSQTSHTGPLRVKKTSKKGIVEADQIDEEYDDDTYGEETSREDLRQ